MNIAIDFDGTISRSPRLLLQLAQALRNSGHSVIILTAAAGELPPEKRPREVAHRLIKLGLGWQPYLKSIVCCESHEKPAICKGTPIHLLIDDTRFKLEPPTLQLAPVP